MADNLRGQKEFEAQYLDQGILRDNIPTESILVRPHQAGLVFYVHKTYNDCWASLCNWRMNDRRAATISDFVSTALALIEPKICPGSYAFLLTMENRDISKGVLEKARRIFWRDADFEGWKIQPLRVEGTTDKTKFIGMSACFKALWSDNDFFVNESPKEIKPGDTAGFRSAINAIHRAGYRGAEVEVNGRVFYFPNVVEERWKIVDLIESPVRAYHIGTVVVENPAYPGLRQNVTKGICKVDASDMYHNRSEYLDTVCVIQHDAKMGKNGLLGARLKHLKVHVW